MPKIQRKTQKVFCNSADSDQLAVFGSMSTGTPVYSSDVEELQSNEAFDLGWDAATLEDKAPFMEEMNGVQYGLTYQIAYGLQEGIPEYDSATTYYIGSICKVLEDGKPVLYTSLTDDNIGNDPVNDSTNWERLSFGGGGLEIGDVGFTQMAIDESKGKRRILNGQLIIQDQYVQFTNIIKNSVALNPDLACTEAEWQTELTMSANGVCYKYVIDDEAGTIRLPKYPDYLDLSINGAKTVSVYGNGKAMGLQTKSGVRYMAGQSASGEPVLRRSSSGGNVGATLGNVSNSEDQNLLVGLATNPSLTGIVGSVTTSSEQIEGTYFIQVATGAETEDNIVNEIELNNPFFLGMSQYFETEPNNVSWLKSEGQWNAKAVYPTVYDWALINANNGIEGFKLVTDTYTDYDYVINTADETFRLPLLNGSEDLLSDKYEDLTLEADGSTYTAPANGWFYISKNCSSGQHLKVFLLDENDNLLSCTYEVASANGFITILTAISKGYKYKIFYNASGATNEFRFIYAQGNGSLYYYVGETVQNANLVNIGRIQEQYTTKSMVDGQWVKTSQTLASSFSLKSGGVSTYDLSPFLPNDGYNYEVWFTVTGSTGSTNGNSAEIRIGSDLLDNSFNIICAGQTRSSASVNYAGTTVTPVGAGRYLNITNTGNATATITFFRIAGYRRIGTNL